MEGKRRLHQRLLPQHKAEGNKGNMATCYCVTGATACRLESFEPDYCGVRNDKAGDGMEDEQLVKHD